MLNLARNILDNYDSTYTDVDANRTAGVRTRTRTDGIRRPLFTNSTNHTNLSNTLFTSLNNFYDNVPIYPTAEQITNGTRRILYSTIEEPLNVSCPITLERFENNTEVLQILGCNHIFNENSLHQWFQSNVRCPVCRYDIREYVPLNRRRRSRYVNMRGNNYDDDDNDEVNSEEHKESDSFETFTNSGSTLRTSSESPEPHPRNTIPEPTQDSSSEFISNLTTVTENLLTDLFSSSFPNSQFNFNGTTYSVDLSNNEIIFAPTTFLSIWSIFGSG